MYRMTRYLAPLLFSATLLTSAVTTGCAARGETRVRIYDGDHHDWHDWDDREEHHYRFYLAEQHRDYRDFHRLKDREKSEYWQWRHNHPDSDR